MRFTYVDSMIDPSFYKPLAIAAEEAGYDSFGIPDSLCYPELSDSSYPDTADGGREFLDDKPFIEPFTLISYLASVTEKLRFTTFVVKLPMRHPVIAAKQAASVAVLSGNRFGFGIGLSPWPDDFRVVDVPWERRGVRFDEQIDIVRGLTRGGYFSYDGEIYQLESVKICPVPTQPIPLLIGGHSKPALRRAARVGDGWMHAGAGGGEDLGELIAQLTKLRAEYGRENEPFEVHAISMDAYTPDGVKRMEEMGITDAIVGFRNSYSQEQDTQSLEEKLAALRGFADTVIAKLG
jgi:probable F420-dependent oxidoreductase